MIVLLAAVPVETELLRQRLTPCEILDCGGFNLYRGKLCGQSVELLHSGIGKANAAAATALLLQRRPDKVLAFGCGGAFAASGLTIGDVALATAEIYGDEGVLTPEGFVDLQGMNLPLVNRDNLRLYNQYPVDAAWLAQAEARLAAWAAATGIQVQSGPLVTVSTCSGTRRSGNALAARTGGICENMEGAAVAQLCARAAVPFLSVRGISNLVEDRDLSRWDLRRGANVAQQAVLALLAAEQEVLSA